MELGRQMVHRGEAKANTMTTAEYLEILARLGLPPYGQATCEALGLSERHIARLAQGNQPVTPMLERLLRCYECDPRLLPDGAPHRHVSPPSLQG